MPDVATFQEQGVQSRAFQLTGFQSCVAHIGTPMPIVLRMNELLVAATQSPKIKQMLTSQAVDDPAFTY